MTKTPARFFVSAEGRCRDFRVDCVRIQVLRQRRFQLNRARGPGEILLWRSIVAMQASFQLGCFVLKGLTALRFAVVEVRLPYFPADVAEQSQKRDELREPERPACKKGRKRLRRGRKVSQLMKNVLLLGNGGGRRGGAD